MMIFYQFVRPKHSDNFTKLKTSFSIIPISMLRLLAVTGLFISFTAQAQIHPLLQQISDLQCYNDPFYRDGMFPSQRVAHNGKVREDNTIFFTALTVFTLKSLYTKFSAEEKLLCDSIVKSASRNLRYYQNRNGLPTYNFWQVYPFEQPFPNRTLWSKMPKFRLADDLDDTSIIYLIMAKPDSIHQVVKRMMEIQIDDEAVYGTLKQYRYKSVYPTWFADKMKQDLDICVISNVLLFVFKKKLPLTPADQHSIDFIKEIISTKEYLKQPKEVSPHYQNSAVILYHVTRLVSEAHHPDLDKIKQMLIADINNLLKGDLHPMEKMILQSSLLKLNPNQKLDTYVQSADERGQNFYWFCANTLAGRRPFFRNSASKLGFVQSSYRSQAYYVSLRLEWEILSGR